MSLRARVTIKFTTVLAVVLAAAGAFLYGQFAADLRETQDRGLRSRAGQLITAVQRDVLSERLPVAPGIEADEDVAQVLAADGSVLAGSEKAQQPLLTRAQLAAALRRRQFVDREGDAGLDERMRLLATPVPGRRAVAVVGASHDEVAEDRTSLLVLEVVGLGGALLAGAAGAWLLAGAVVRPVAAALEREQRFVADASHELRTPLAILKSELEVTRMEAGDADALRTALASAEEEVDRLGRLAEDLLVLARTDDRGLALQPVSADLDAVLTRAARGFPEVELARSGLRVQADELRLEQAVRNLIDNAGRHGLTPVTVSASDNGDAVTISVRDRGGGVPPGLDPFARFAGTGTGLGLAIVEAIAQAHGGSVRLRPASPGTVAELAFPHRPLMPPGR